MRDSTKIKQSANKNYPYFNHTALSAKKYFFLFNYQFVDSVI